MQNTTVAPDITEMKAAFAEQLPADARRRITTNETALEYQRLLLLADGSVGVTLKRGTLLADFAATSGQSSDSFSLGDDLSQETREAYLARFEVLTPYPWTHSTSGDLHVGPTPASP